MDAITAGQSAATLNHYLRVHSTLSIHVESRLALQSTLENSAPRAALTAGELADSWLEEPTVPHITWLPRRFTCSRCGQRWWSTTRASQRPFTKRWRGCPTCGPAGGFVQ